VYSTHKVRNPGGKALMRLRLELATAEQKYSTYEYINKSDTVKKVFTAPNLNI
jgi:hypothetical protein